MSCGMTPCQADETFTILMGEKVEPRKGPLRSGPSMRSIWIIDPLKEEKNE